MSETKPQASDGEYKSLVDVVLDSYASEMGFGSQKDIPLDQFTALCRASGDIFEAAFNRFTGISSPFSEQKSESAP